MVAEIEVKLTSQTLVWQFRLSKSGPALRAPEISRAGIASCDVTKSSDAKRCLAGRGRARQDFSQGGEKVAWPNGIHGLEPWDLDPTHLFARMLLREPRASLADPAGGGYCHRPMPDQPARVRLLWPSPHGLQSHPSAAGTGNHRARARDPSGVRVSRPFARA
jgi:hypothetical protein